MEGTRTWYKVIELNFPYFYCAFVDNVKFIGRFCWKWNKYQPWETIIKDGVNHTYSVIPRSDQNSISPSSINQLLSRQVKRTKNLSSNKRVLLSCVIKCPELTYEVDCKEDGTSARTAITTEFTSRDDLYFRDVSDSLRHATCQTNA